MNGALFSIFSFINRGFGFFLLMILANYITPAEYGYLSLFNTIVTVLSYFKALSTEGYMSVSYFSDGVIGIKKTISSVFFTSLIFLVSMLLFVTCFSSYISKTINLPVYVFYYALIIAFFTLYVNVNLDYYRILGRVKIYGILSCGNAILNFVLSILLVKCLLLGWEGRIYSQLICYSLFGVLGLICFIRGGYIAKPNCEHWKVMIYWGVPLIPHLAAQFVRQGCDTYIINHYHTIEDVGLFNFAFTLTSIISMVGMGFNQSNSVDIYKILGDKTLSNIQKQNKILKQKKYISIIYLCAAAIITLAVYILVPFVLPKYAHAMNYFVILSFYGLGICIYYLYTNFLFFYKKTKAIMHVTFGSACCHLLLSLLLTRYSLYITCLLYVLSQLCIVLLIRNLANKQVALNLKK